MIPGLYLFEDFITESQESSLLAYIDEQEWNVSLSRRVQHYGYAYDDISSKSGFAKSKAKLAAKISDDLADIRDEICEFINENCELNEHFNQCIINEYTRGQGIGGHVDHISFGPVIISVSLNDDCEFVFESIDSGEKRSVWVPHRSMLVLTGESRYKWKHSVPTRIGMFCDGQKIPRHSMWRRVSATFRTLDL